ncbi:Clavaminate synthase-like protein [Hesseltinella vesiculosa]|uniref:Clavaminate synthase-like protein n=1 Tax=Hesseltinella vesiculosa TaxID=101127 RepID=A0A1X2GQV1_9FUNG|nr:Clavaminate synthase-like protein [Hesseltinella vesiculosa]
MDNDSIAYYDDPPSYSTFLNKHLLGNQPAVIGPKWIDHWPARQNWIQPLAGQGDHQPQWQPDYEYLRRTFGQAKVQVALCDEQEFSDQKRIDMTFDEFVTQWQQPGSLHYLKDWHFAKAFPDQVMYQVPELFADDWMNEYWLQHSEDDYRFCYMGGHGTFTPFHADVYRSYSWSCNICGIKKWTLYPPGQEDLFKDRLGNLVYDVRHVDPEQFPQFHKARSIVIYQRDGETVFIPSNWFHQVENIGATISINHNWLNATNIEKCFESMCQDLKQVECSLSDLQETMDPFEFVTTSQHVLLLHSGWNWSTLHRLLACIEQRLRLNKDPCLQPEVPWQLAQVQSLQARLGSFAFFSPFVESILDR